MSSTRESNVQATEFVIVTIRLVRSCGIFIQIQTLSALQF